MSDRLKMLLCAGVVAALMPSMRPLGGIILGLQEERMDAINKRVLAKLSELGNGEGVSRYALAEAILDEMGW